MTPERWHQVKQVFQKAIDLPPDRRRAFLAEACGPDAELRREAESLLAAEQEAGDFIVQPAFETQGLPEAPEGVDPMIGRRLGPYRVEKPIGRGGMGTVYLASRADREYEKSVAIKMVSRGMDTDMILRRFRNERQILVDHARSRHRLKRGGAVMKVTWVEDMAGPDPTGLDLVGLDDALNRLAVLDPQQSRVIELRFFGGLSIEETAESLNVSPATVKREWAMARAWLFRELNTGNTGV